MLPITLGLACCLMAAPANAVGVVARLFPPPESSPDPTGTADDVRPGAFAYNEAPELHFGCVGVHDANGAYYADRLADRATTPARRVAAARALWRGQSRRHAAAVLQFAAGPPPGGEAFRAFQRDIAAAITPSAVVREMQTGQFRWGAYLAFLRPHPKYVPVLLARLGAEPKGPLDHVADEAVLALGNSGDARAAAPLVARLKSPDGVVAAAAATALGYLGRPETEPALLAALADSGGFPQARVCQALGRAGTAKSLPALDKLAADPTPGNLVDRQGAAAHAAATIRRRLGL